MRCSADLFIITDSFGEAGSCQQKAQQKSLMFRWSRGEATANALIKMWHKNKLSQNRIISIWTLTNTNNLYSLNLVTLLCFFQKHQFICLFILKSENFGFCLYSAVWSQFFIATGILPYVLISSLNLETEILAHFSEQNSSNWLDGKHLVLYFAKPFHYIF